MTKKNAPNKFTRRFAAGGDILRRGVSPAKLAKQAILGKGKARRSVKRRAEILTMNMIVCDKNCRHQQEGYCGLNQITSLKAATDTKCGYYEARAAAKKSEKTVTSSASQAPAQFR